MDTKFAIIIIVIIAQVYGGCINCGFGPGRDVCNSRCTPIRHNIHPTIEVTHLCKPKMICMQVPHYQPLKPIGDLCSCNSVIVKPAVVPKPPCALCKPARTCCCSSYSGPSYDCGCASNNYGGCHHSFC